MGTARAPLEEQGRAGPFFLSPRPNPQSLPLACARDSIFVPPASPQFAAEKFFIHSDTRGGEGQGKKTWVVRRFEWPIRSQPWACRFSRAPPRWGPLSNQKCDVFSSPPLNSRQGSSGGWFSGRTGLPFCPAYL